MTERTVIALGFFDGIHLGHQALLRECCAMAEKLGCLPGVVTFESHPDGLVFGKTPGLINTLADRDRLLRKYGVEKVFSLPFDREMMQMPGQEFYDLVRSRCGAAGLVCGEDFTFGSRGMGNAVLLQQACARDGIPCTVVPQLRLDDVPVSSTFIRSLMESGDMERMDRFLGHPHLLTGTVTHGRQLGRTLGIPTANLQYPGELQSLRRGVYACLAEFDGKLHPAVTNVGTRPTVDGQGVTVEPWILQYDGDLYGREISLWFYRFLRPEKRFDTLEELQAEIRKNGEEVAKIFGIS